MTFQKLFYIVLPLWIAVLGRALMIYFAEKKLMQIAPVEEKNDPFQRTKKPRKKSRQKRKKKRKK